MRTWCSSACARCGGPAGPGFIAAKVQQWLRDNRIKTIYIDPGSPWKNGYIESFHSRFRDECLNREMLLNLREARVVIADWRQHCNRERPHSRLGYLSPEDFIQTKILVSHTLTGPIIRSRSRVVFGSCQKLDVWQSG
ncbi:MAG: transposase [Gemmatimonadetes bacterium]|nr:transposase [Gemmatimonadota bacterium]